MGPWGGRVITKGHLCCILRICAGFNGWGISWLFRGLWSGRGWNGCSGGGLSSWGHASLIAMHESFALPLNPNPSRTRSYNWRDPLSCPQSVSTLRNCQTIESFLTLISEFMWMDQTKSYNKMVIYFLVWTDLSQFVHLWKVFLKSLRLRDKWIESIFLDSLKSQKSPIRFWVNYPKVGFAFRWNNKELFPVSLCLWMI